jgi:ubiquinone/menaquinone biosynthesis C-methylase UbiE
MENDLTSYRNSDRERARINDLLDLLPERGHIALDIGARDAYVSTLLADRFDIVVALDLSRPNCSHPRVKLIQSDARSLPFSDRVFDCVLCAEVLEHIPSKDLEQVCAEITRVTNTCAVVGVPYEQDLRVGRTTCLHCGHRNPPWGHVNSFDKDRLTKLFPEMRPAGINFVGKAGDSTTALATALLDFAGNPYGTYEQDERCVQCGTRLTLPIERTLIQKFATKAAHYLNSIQHAVSRRKAGWMHLRFEKLDVEPSFPPAREKVF